MGAYWPPAQALGPFLFHVTVTEETYCHLASKKFVWNLFLNDKQTIIYILVVCSIWQSLASTFLLASCSVNAKIVPAHTTTTWASGGRAPFIFNLGTIRSNQFHAPSVDPWRNNLPYPLNWALQLMWKGKMFCSYWVMNNDTSVVRPVAYSLDYAIPVNKDYLIGCRLPVKCLSTLPEQSCRHK